VKKIGQSSEENKKKTI